MSFHEKYSPSTADKWIDGCPGAVEAEQAHPNSSSEPAEEGTAAHELGATVLLKPGSTCHDHIGEVFNKDNPLGLEFICDEEMADYVQEYVDSVRRYQGTDGLLFVEVATPKYEKLPESGGTSDAVIIREKEKELQVHDLKYGRGISVYAQDNKQLQLYALFMYRLHSMFHDIQFIKLCIHQPRKRNPSEWCITVEQLLEFEKKAIDAYQTAINNPGVFIPGDKQCQWCRHKSVCPEIAKTAMEIVTTKATPDDYQDISKMVPRDIETLTLDEMAKYLPYESVITSWFKKMHEYAHEQAQQGHKVPNHKLIEGRKGNKKWVNETKAKATLKKMKVKVADQFKKVFVTPTQAMALKVLGPKQKEELEGLYSQSPGNIKLVPEAHASPAIEIALAEAYEDVSGVHTLDLAEPKSEVSIGLVVSGDKAYAKEVEPLADVPADDWESAPVSNSDAESIATDKALAAGNVTDVEVITNSEDDIYG